MLRIKKHDFTPLFTRLKNVFTHMCLHRSIDGPVDGAVHEGLITITHTSSERLSHLMITT